MAFLLVFAITVFSIRWQTFLLPEPLLLLFVCAGMLILIIANYWLPLTSHQYSHSLKHPVLIKSLLIFSSAIMLALAYSHFHAYRLLDKALDKDYCLKTGNEDW